MNNEKLFELVKIYIGLFDLSSVSYSDCTWKEIADELQFKFEYLSFKFKHNTLISYNFRVRTECYCKNNRKNIKTTKSVRMYVNLYSPLER